MESDSCSGIVDAADFAGKSAVDIVEDAGDSVVVDSGFVSQLVEQELVEDRAKGPTLRNGHSVFK